MAKSIGEKAIEKAALIMVGEVTRKFSKQFLNFVEGKVKDKSESLEKRAEDEEEEQKI